MVTPKDRRLRSPCAEVWSFTSPARQPVDSCRYRIVSHPDAFPLADEKPRRVKIPSQQSLSRLRLRLQRKDSLLRFRFQLALGRIARMAADRSTPPPLHPRFVRRVPEGDTTERFVCGDCGHIHYTNPKIVVGSVVTYRNRILLCRRAIDPRKGFWTLPAGYLEENETPEDGARREAREEARCDIVLEGLLAVYSIPRISQVQLMYRARLDTEKFAAGAESLD